MGNIKLDVVPASTGEDNVRFELRAPLRVLGISVGVVLLICCTNIASLLMGRASARSREIGVRLALGASRCRIIRQLLTESVVLGAGGGGLGLLTGFWVHHLLTALLAIDRSAAVQFRLHMPLLVFTAAVSLFTGILFGLAPALRAARLDLYVAIRGETLVAGRLRLGPTRTLLIVQVAASIVLLLVATLFVRTLRNLERVDAGFNREHLLLLAIDPRESRFQGDHVAALFDDLMERIPTVGSVRSAALALIVLFGQSANKEVWVQGVTQNSGAVAFNFVGPGFFSNAGIPLLMGREFSLHDRAGAPMVAIVNEVFAREYFPGQNPVGRRFGDQGPSSAGKYEIVGVVKDSRYTSLRQKPYPAIIQALWQFPQQFEPQPFVLHVRMMGDPGVVASNLLREIQAIDMNLVVYDIRTMTDQVKGSLRQERMFAMLSALFGALALGLCCVGLYDLASYSVVRRTREIGLRMALGAVRADILWLVLREALTLLSIGVVMGIPVALASTRLLQSLLFGLTPADPSSLTMAMLMLVGVAALAALLPACRASRIDPMCALRHE
jgi:predicted permease